MAVDDIKQQRRCRCCNKNYDYAVAGSHATRFICQDCAQIAEPLRRVLISFNKRLGELEAHIKMTAPQKRAKEQ